MRVPGILSGRSGDYGRPFASKVWTICVPSLLLLSLLLLITKKVIATGVMKHDRFVAIDVHESRRPIGLRAGPKHQRFQVLEVKRSSRPSAATAGCLE